MHVRLAGPADLAKLLPLYVDLNPDDQPLEDAAAKDRLARLRHFPGSGVYVGWIGDEAVATCTLVVIPNLTRGGAPYALIENVVTAAAHRNRGYGKALLRSAVEAAFADGCYKVMLLTGSTAASTHGFYRSAGFEQSKTGYQIRNIEVRAE